MVVLDVIQALSVIAASWAAVYGIGVWRREHVGKHRVDLAEEVLTLFYEAHDVIRTVRSPLGFEGEGSSRKGGEKESEEEKKALDYAYVPLERYNRRKDVFNRLHSLRYRFRVLFGKEAAKPFEDLRTIIHEILGAANTLSRIARMSNTGAQSIREQIEKAEATLGHTWSESDQVAERMDRIIGEIEQTCSGVICKRP